jgi:two-component sensor histidine kinase
VKNNLQMVSSLLYLQSEMVNDPHTLSVLQESMNRVKAMALVHEQLYRSKDLADVDFGTFLHTFSSHLLQAYGKAKSVVSLHVDVQDIHLAIDQAIPCALIVNELITPMRLNMHFLMGRPVGFNSL